MEYYYHHAFFSCAALLKVFVAVSNIGSGQSLSRSITFHPYKEGQSTYVCPIIVRNIVFVYYRESFRTLYHSSLEGAEICTILLLYRC